MFSRVLQLTPFSKKYQEIVTHAVNAHLPTKHLGFPKKICNKKNYLKIATNLPTSFVRR